MDLVVSNLAGSLEALFALALAQGRHADVLELRLDACAGATVEELRHAFASLPRPVLAAANGPEAYGTFAGSDGERIELLERASSAGAAWIDVPWTLAREQRAGSVREASRATNATSATSATSTLIATAAASAVSAVSATNAAIVANATSSASAGPRARRIVSRHVLDGTPADLAALVAEIERVAEPDDRIKLVTHATCAEDGLRMLLLARDRARAGRPIAAFTSGAAGSFTRALAPVCGSLATYAAPARASGGHATAPGQIEADVLRAMWPANGATSSTRILGVAGRPVGASLSPRLHGAALRRVGFDAVYVAFEPANFDAFLALATELGVHGLSVTMPFKADAARLATSRDDAVVACGAANTLVRTPNGWHATNTDASAVRTCIGRALCGSGFTLPDAVAVVVGTGGAARAALHGLRGAELVVAGRDAAMRERLAGEFGAESCSIDELEDVPHDILVNTTPVGSRAQPGEIAVPARALRHESIVFDAVYRPSDTPLLLAARAIGARTIEGREWFLEQALAQFRAFTGADAPAESMRIELARALLEDAP